MISNGDRIENPETKGSETPAPFRRFEELVERILALMGSEIDLMVVLSLGRAPLAIALLTEELFREYLYSWRRL